MANNTWCLLLPTGWCFSATGHQRWCLGGGWALKWFSRIGILHSLCLYFPLSLRWWLLGGGESAALMREETHNRCCQDLFFLLLSFLLLPSNVFPVLWICLCHLWPSVLREIFAPSRSSFTLFILFCPSHSLSVWLPKRKDQQCVSTSLRHAADLSPSCFDSVL